MDTATLFSAAAVIISLIGLILSSRKDTRSDAADGARMEAKLDSISGGVEDIRVEMRSMRGRIDALSERVASVENSCKSAHHRLDQLQDHHPPDRRAADL